MTKFLRNKLKLTIKNAILAMMAIESVNVNRTVVKIASNSTTNNEELILNSSEPVNLLQQRSDVLEAESVRVGVLNRGPLGVCFRFCRP